MNYVSIFSGIEAASVAWEPLGWEPLAFAEIEPFPCRVLAERFPDVPNLGDVSKIDWSPYRGSVDVLVGGSPCQAFSVSGHGGGLDDPRGRLMLEFVRAVHDIQPRWFVWENVPGVLSQDRGRAFGTLLGTLDDLGYGLAWRVLDAQFYGVAQRRRRVFLVGGSTVGRASAVLFEPASLQGSSSASRAKREALTRAARQGAQGEGGGLDGTGAICSQSGAKQQTYVATQYGDIAASLTARYDSSACPDRGQTIVSMMDLQANSTVEEDLLGTLTAHVAKGAAIIAQPVNSAGEDVVGALCAADEKLIGDQMERQGKVVAEPNGCGWTVRRLTPLECERLQGFPDGFTAIEGARDAPRYKAIGNSMAVPVMRWIGERIMKVEGC